MQERLKIAIFHDLPSGGAKRSLYQYCSCLSSRGHILDAFIPETADENYLPLDDVVTRKIIYPVNSKRILKRVTEKSNILVRFLTFHMDLYYRNRCQKEIADDINKGDYDIAFVHHSAYTQSPFLLRYLSVPSVYFMQEPKRGIYEAPIQEYEAPRGSLRSLYAESILRRTDQTNIKYASLVLTNSYYSHESIMRAYGLNSKVCYLGVDTKTFRPIAGEVKENFVLSVGGLHVHKGFRFIIKVLAKINAAIRPGLVIVADREDVREKHSLQQIARDYGVELEIKTNATDEELCGYYNKALLVVYAPYLEPFGLVPLEAMACGTPVVGVKEGGVRESVKDGLTGLLVDRDEELFAESISLLLANRSLMEKLGKQGVKYVKSEWSWELSTKKLLELIAGCDTVSPTTSIPQ